MKHLYVNSCLEEKYKFETSTRDSPWKPDEKNKITSMHLFAHFDAKRINSRVTFILDKIGQKYISYILMNKYLIDSIVFINYWLKR